MKILDSRGITIEEFNNLFRQCSVCKNVMVASNTKDHICQGSNFFAFSFFVDRFITVASIDLRGCALTHLGRLPPQDASARDIYKQAHSKEGISAPTFERTFSFCACCSFCMTFWAAKYHRCMC
jgi:hypothetical protein